MQRLARSACITVALLLASCSTDGPGENFNRQMRQQQCAGYSPGQQPYEDWGCADL